jgi:hypothetical protein
MRKEQTTTISVGKSVFFEIPISYKTRLFLELTFWLYDQGRSKN